MADHPRNNGGKTGRRDDGTFAPGNPGRPKGARHRTTRAVEELLDGEAKGLTRKAVDLALAGDTTALRLCMERIAPPRKDAPVTFAMPEMATASDALSAISSIVQAVASGELTPGEGSSLAGLVEQFRRSAEIEELERRIEKLEQAQ